MYRVGICDDAKGVCAALEKMILQFAGQNNLDIETEIWYTGEGLCDDLEKNICIDLLFLDIELFQMSGTDVGYFIRNCLGNREMQIVYISGKSSYACELFRTQPMEFMVKPITQEQVNHCLELAIKLIGRGRKRFVFQSGKDYFYIPYGEILYFISEGRKIKIMTDNGEKEFYGKLRDVYKELPQYFLVIHKSYVVNSERVYRYAYESLELSNGTILPISKAHRKQVREKILREDVEND